MKLKILTYQLDPSIESMIQKGHTNNNAFAATLGKRLADRKLPALKGDRLENYTGELKARYEKLAADVFLLIQPASHGPEARVDAEYLKIKDREIVAKIAELKHQNENDEYLLQNSDAATVQSRINWAIAASLLIAFGEVVFNAKAFQVTGENLLMAMILSISVTAGISLFSHRIPQLYKSASSLLQKKLVIAGSLLLVTVVFIALAIFRSKYLASHDVYIQPFYFVIINLFFFVVSTLLSFYILPTWHEIKEWWKYRKISKHIEKREKQKKHLEEERKSFHNITLKNTKERIKLLSSSHYLTDRFKKMYFESVEILKTNIIAFRRDHKTPDCFSQVLPEPKINQVSYSFIGTPTDESSSPNPSQNQQIP